MSLNLLFSKFRLIVTSLNSECLGLLFPKKKNLDTICYWWGLLSMESNFRLLIVISEWLCAAISPFTQYDIFVSSNNGIHRIPIPLILSEKFWFGLILFPKWKFLWTSKVHFYRYYKAHTYLTNMEIFMLTTLYIARYF